MANNILNTENRFKKDIEDGKKIALVFSELSEESKTMAIVYLSALRDKELADSDKKAVWDNKTVSDDTLTVINWI